MEWERSRSLLRPGPHLPPLPLQSPHTLLPPLGSHGQASLALLCNVQTLYIYVYTRIIKSIILKTSVRIIEVTTAQ